MLVFPRPIYVQCLVFHVLANAKRNKTLKTYPLAAKQPLIDYARSIATLLATVAIGTASRYYR